MLFKSKSNRNLIKNKDLSLLHLTTLSNFLESEQSLTQNITKEIKNQINLSKKNQKIIDKSIIKINGQAQQLVRRYEEEKQKNEKLQFLVKHIEEEIYRVKLDKANQLKNNIQTDRLEQFTNILKSKQKELEKICQKTNTSSYQLSKKLDVIRALRGERTIVSQLLDKIQRQLCNLEHCYKVLVIERTVGDRQYRQKIQDFNKLQLSANKQLQKVIFTSQRGNRYDKQIEQVNIGVKINDNNLNRNSFLGISNGYDSNQRHTIQSQFNKDKDKDKGKQKNIRLQNDIAKLQRQKKCKIILNDLGLSSTKQLPSTLQQLHLQNQQLLRKITQVYEQIENEEKAISRLTKKRKIKGEVSYQRRSYMGKIQQLKKVGQQIKSNRLQTRQFKQIAKILYESIKQSRGQQVQLKQFFNEQQQIILYMDFLQNFFEKSYLDNKKNKFVQHNDGSTSKRLTSLLNSHHFQRNHMSIYQEKDLLDFAKKNLEKMERAGSKTEK